MLNRVISRAYSSGARPSISSTMFLSRNPIVTADLPEFENQYYKYQKELWKRLMWTFPKWFYYREGTLGEQRFRELNKSPVFNNPNIEFPHGRPEIRHQRDRRFKQEIKLPKTYSEAEEESGEVSKPSDDLSRKIVPNSRITKADETKDYSSLERKLSRTLYLIIKDKSGWILPTFENDALEPLHELAKKGLTKIGGENINLFVVSNTPCHLHQNQNGNKEYFIKSHILSGKFSPTDTSLQYLWLTKEELKTHLDKEYYSDIEHLLSDV